MFTVFRNLRPFLRRSLCTDASPAIASVFTSEGFDADIVASLLKANPNLQNFSPDSLRNSIDLFRNQGFPAENFLRIIDKHPPILTTPAAQLCNNLEIWRASQFGERYVQILVTEHPHLLDMKIENRHAEQKIMERLMYLKDYVQTKKNVWRLLVASPNVIVDRIADVDEKRVFFEEEMKVEHTEVVKTTAFSHPMHKIRMRHEFLVRLGMYKPKNPKADPTLKSTNPSLYQIVDTNDKRFATKVALVSLEEFEVFQEIYKREVDRKTRSQRIVEDDEDDDDAEEEDDQEMDYERNGN